MVQPGTQILCQNPPMWALLGSAQAVCSGGSLSRWCNIEEREHSKTSQLLSLNQYIAFCEVRVQLTPWAEPRVGAGAGAAVSPAVGEAAVQAPALQTAACPDQILPHRSSSLAEGLLVTLCSGSVLSWDMWSTWHELMALGGVKISFGYLENQGGFWLWVSFWKCSVPEQKPAGGAGSRHFPARDPLHFLQRVIPLLLV